MVTCQPEASKAQCVFSHSAHTDEQCKGKLETKILQADVEDEEPSCSSAAVWILGPLASLVSWGR